MSELEEHWTKALDEAARRARAMGRKDVAEYVALRATNDSLRRTAIDWLLTTFTVMAGEANRAGSSLQVTEHNGHKFRIGHATMVGRLLTIRLGVRELRVEAGWPRTPPDGFVRGGGLACAHIRHLGRPHTNDELLLIQTKKKVPQWKIMEKSGERSVLTKARIRRHLAEMLQP